MSEAIPELTVGAEEEPKELQRKRTRPRDRRYSQERKNKIVQRVLDCYRRDEQDRAEDQDRRLERYAKIRGWTESDDGSPWPNSSNIALPDIARACEETQDTLVNAALATRPTVIAHALDKRGVDRERTLSQMLDTQFYEEQGGEQALHEMAQVFTEEGSFVTFVPWVEEHRGIVDRASYDPIPENEIPVRYFKTLMNNRFPPGEWEHYQRGEDGWSYRVQKGRESRFVEFFTKNEPMGDSVNVPDDVEMVVTYDATVFKGPKVIVMDYEDVLTPARSANLQIPGPSNPRGATHVILRDQPTMDEIRRLVKQGWYDLAKMSDIDALDGHSDLDDAEEKKQKDVMQGIDKPREAKDFMHRDFTRLTCFDIFDFEDGQGSVDMVWTVLVEPQLLLKASRLTELYPVPDGSRPMRPLAEASYLPVKGWRQGRSLPELMEGMHDYIKSIWDQMKDGADMSLTPFFFYQPSSEMNPEISSVSPGEGYPMENPSQNIFFPNINTQGQAFGLNMITMASQMQEKLTVLGDIQQGRVPAGRSSAFRTTGNLQALLAQGEARPERVLRRFFMGVTSVFRLMHRLNQFYLPKEKQFRFVGVLEPNEDPYKAMSREEIRNSRFDFTFEANVQNASLLAKQQALQQAASVILNPLSIQMGFVTPEDAYRLTRDLARTSASDVDQYLTPPSPVSTRRKITAEGALTAILHNEIPQGLPLEGAQQHLGTIEKLLDMQQRGGDGITVVLKETLSPGQAAILSEYLKDLSEVIQAELEQEQRTEAAKQSIAGGQQQPGAQPGAADTTAPPVQANELIDESLPTAGGGAVQ
jgi:hypothetical protein